MTAQDAPDTLSVSNSIQQVTFDKHTGTLQSWRVNGQDVLLGGPTLNLGEGKAGSEGGMYRAKQPPVTTDAQVSATPGKGGAMRVSVTSTVLASPGGATLGTLVSTYDLKPNAEMTVALDPELDRRQHFSLGGRCQVLCTDRPDPHWPGSGTPTSPTILPGTSVSRRERLRPVTPCSGPPSAACTG